VVSPGGGAWTMPRALRAPRKIPGVRAGQEAPPFLKRPSAFEVPLKTVRRVVERRGRQHGRDQSFDHPAAMVRGRRASVLAPALERLWASRASGGSAKRDRRTGSHAPRQNHTILAAVSDMGNCARRPTCAIPSGPGRIWGVIRFFSFSCAEGTQRDLLCRTAVGSGAGEGRRLTHQCGRRPHLVL
jgi:hypothetical protein